MLKARQNTTADLSKVALTAPDVLTAPAPVRAGASLPGGVDPDSK